MSDKLRVKKLHDDALLPVKAHDTDLGYDLFALEETFLEGGSVTLVRTGIACKFPDGHGAILKDRSSVATKIKVFVKAGVIDESYTGEIKVAIFNPTKGGTFTDITIERGFKLAQMVLVPTITREVEEVEELEETERGDKGFGSSGS